MMSLDAWVSRLSILSIADSRRKTIPPHGKMENDRFGPIVGIRAASLDRRLGVNNSVTRTQFSYFVFCFLFLFLFLFLFISYFSLPMYFCC